MAEIQLNKALYKAGGEGTTAESKPVVPKPGRASIMPRMGAVLLDILLLHFVYLLLIKVAPGLTVRLGRAGEWVGLLGAWAYFSICGSHLCLGRSLGKLFLRLQVGDEAGPDLPLGRAMVRAALLLSGCVATIALEQYAAARDTQSELDPLPTFLKALGWAINAGWLLGNLLFSAYEPFGRTLIDRLAGSVVTATDAEPGLLQEHLARVRESIGTPAPKKCYVALLVCVVAACALVIPQYTRFRSELQRLSPEERQRLQRGRSLFQFSGFTGPNPTGRFETPAGDEDKTSTNVAVLAAILGYEHLGQVEPDALKSDPQVKSFHQRAVQAAQNEPDFRESISGLFNNLNLTRIRNEQPGTTIPKLLRMEVSFAERADLFFAWDAVPKYSVSQKLELDPGDPKTSRPLTIRFPAETALTSGSKEQ